MDPFQLSPETEALPLLFPQRPRMLSPSVLALSSVTYTVLCSSAFTRSPMADSIMIQSPNTLIVKAVKININPVKMSTD